MRTLNQGGGPFAGPGPGAAYLALGRAFIAWTTALTMAWAMIPLRRN